MWNWQDCPDMVRQNMSRTWLWASVRNGPQRCVRYLVQIFVRIVIRTSNGLFQKFSRLYQNGQFGGQRNGDKKNKETKDKNCYQLKQSSLMHVINMKIWNKMGVITGKSSPTGLWWSRVMLPASPTTEGPFLTLPAAMSLNSSVYSWATQDEEGRKIKAK